MNRTARITRAARRALPPRRAGRRYPVGACALHRIAPPARRPRAGSRSTTPSVSTASPTTSFSRRSRSSCGSRGRCSSHHSSPKQSVCSVASPRRDVPLTGPFQPIARWLVAAIAVGILTTSTRPAGTPPTALAASLTSLGTTSPRVELVIDVTGPPPATTRRSEQRHSRTDSRAPAHGLCRSARRHALGHLATTPRRPVPLARDLRPQPRPAPARRREPDRPTLDLSRLDTPTPCGDSASHCASPPPTPAPPPAPVPTSTRRHPAVDSRAERIHRDDRAINGPDDDPVTAERRTRARPLGDDRERDQRHDDSLRRRRLGAPRRRQSRTHRPLASTSTPTPPGRARGTKTLRRTRRNRDRHTRSC